MTADSRAAARLLALLTGAILLVAAPTASTTASVGATRWAPAATSKIHPGVQMFTGDAQCTSNFVYTDSRGRVYVGYAAHCAGLGSSTDTNGCETDSVAYGTRVRFGTGSTLLTSGSTVGYGRLVYSSWRNMRERHVTDRNKCAYNDLALVRVGRAYLDRVNPSVPHWGGPVALDVDGIADGARVYSYAASSLRLGSSAHRGQIAATSGNGWTHEVTGSGGVPGDSGSGFLGPDGRAVGTLSTLNIGLGLSNGIGDLGHELRYAQRFSGIRGLRLVPGTESFSGS